MCYLFIFPTSASICVYLRTISRLLPNISNNSVHQRPSADNSPALAMPFPHHHLSMAICGQIFYGTANRPIYRSLASKKCGFSKSSILRASCGFWREKASQNPLYFPSKTVPNPMDTHCILRALFWATPLSSWRCSAQMSRLPAGYDTICRTWVIGFFMFVRAIAFPPQTGD